MIRVQQAWDHFWWQTFDASSLRLFRQSVGVLILLSWLAYAFDFSIFYSHSWLLCLVFGSAILLIADWRPQLSATILYLSIQAITYDSMTTHYGAEALLWNCLIWLMFVPKNGLIPVWPKRMLQLNLTFLWLGGGLAKLKSNNWQSGDGFFRSLIPIERIGTLPESWLHNTSFLLAMNALVPLIEVGLAFFIWIPKFRRVTIYAAIVFHIGVMIVMKLYLFQLTALTLLLLFNTAPSKRN